MTLYVSTLRIGIPSITIALYLFATAYALRFDRSRVTSYTMRNFEDVVIFVADMEREIERLNALEKKLLAMNVLKEYTIPEVSRLLGCTQRGRAVPARCAGPALAGSCLRVAKTSRWLSRSSGDWDCTESSLPSRAPKATGKVT